MVYCGRPSRGCGNCKTKRLKCDQKRPGCGQCRRTGRTCLGYRDINDLVFRDETQRITIKIQKKIEATRATTVEDPSRKANPGATLLNGQLVRQKRLQRRPDQSPIALSIHQSLQDIAVHFLLGDYICDSHFHYLPTLYQRNQNNDILCPIVKALGLASLSLQTSRPELQNQAEKLYVDAIAHTNVALQCKDLARNDDVLAAILLLSLFETLKLRTSIGVEAWTTHMQGALALVALRGPAQFDSEFGLELFKQIAASIRVFCVQRFLRVPQQLRQLTESARNHSHDNDVAFEYPRIVEAFTDLRADMKEGLLTDPEDIIAVAKDVLKKVQDLHDKLPAGLLYETVFVQKPYPEIHGDYYYQFQDHHVAQMWNTTWMAKLHLNNLILEQLLKILSTSTGMIGKRVELACMMMDSKREIMEATDNICATVPQFFPPREEQHINRKAYSAAVGYFLIWPLFTAGSSSLIQPSTKSYIVERLEFMASNFKLPQAKRAAEMIVSNDRMESWMHIFHVF